MAALFEEILITENFEVEVTGSYEIFADLDALKRFDLIVPSITMDKVEEAWIENIATAVAEGTGLAGCHGGMCDTFRENTTWQFMTGGQFVAHPGDNTVEYRVCIKDTSNELVQGLEDFTITSEQYYMHVDPAITVLATTPFPIADGPHTPNGEVEMPVVWTKLWGVGRVYYNSLGHKAYIMEQDQPKELMRRGMLWAAAGKRIARERGIDASSLRSEAKMF